MMVSDVRRASIWEYKRFCLRSFCVPRMAFETTSVAF